MADSISHDRPSRVGIVIGSQRAVRICPQVAQFVLDVVRTHHDSTSNSPTHPKTTFTLLDIAEYDLPLSDEPGMPMRIQDRPGGYTTERTRAWSAAVAAFDAFIFVTPQYNWGFSGALKNAIDHLFHEWAGKPAMVVAYGGFGGTLGAAALLTVLSGMYLQVVKKPVCLTFPQPVADFFERAVKGEALGLDAIKEDGVWAAQRSEIIEVWEDMLSLLVAGGKKPTLRSPGLPGLWEHTLAPLEDIDAKKAAS